MRSGGATPEIRHNFSGSRIVFNAIHAWLGPWGVVRRLRCTSYRIEDRTPTLAAGGTHTLFCAPLTEQPQRRTTLYFGSIVDTDSDSAAV